MQSLFFSLFQVIEKTFKTLVNVLTRAFALHASSMPPPKREMQMVVIHNVFIHYKTRFMLPLKVASYAFPERRKHKMHARERKYPKLFFIGVSFPRGDPEVLLFFSNRYVVIYLQFYDEH